MRFPWLRWLVSAVLRESLGVTVNSRYTAGLLKYFNYTKESLLAYPGVNSLLFHPGPSGDTLSQFGVPHGRRLLTVSRLAERKGHDLVISALPQLIEAFPDIQYVIAGHGPREQALKQMVQDRGLEARVHFLGLISDIQVAEIIRECSVFVHPNRITTSGDIEGFGIVFLEAQASGVPVLGGRSGGVPESVHDGHTGYLVNEPQRLEDFVDKLSRILGDDNLRQKIGRAHV